MPLPKTSLETAGVSGPQSTFPVWKRGFRKPYGEVAWEQSTPQLKKCPQTKEHFPGATGVAHEVASYYEVSIETTQLLEVPLQKNAKNHSALFDTPPTRRTDSAGPFCCLRYLHRQEEVVGFSFSPDRLLLAEAHGLSVGRNLFQWRG